MTVKLGQTVRLFDIPGLGAIYVSDKVNYTTHSAEWTYRNTTSKPVRLWGSGLNPSTVKAGHTLTTGPYGYSQLLPSILLASGSHLATVTVAACPSTGTSLVFAAQAVFQWLSPEVQAAIEKVAEWLQHPATGHVLCGNDPIDKARTLFNV
jgi:hypothetical protein